MVSFEGVHPYAKRENWPAKKFTKVAGSAPEREGSTRQFSTGFPTWAGLRPWPDPGRILGGSCHALARGITCRRARRVAEHPLRYHMVSCRGLPPAPTWNKVSHFCNGPRLPCAQCAEHEALETAHTSQSIMDIYGQGLQRSMASVLSRIILSSRENSSTDANSMIMKTENSPKRGT